MEEDAADPEVALAIAYAPAPKRAALAAMWRLDARLAAIVRATTEPLLGQMRLVWWRDALRDLAAKPVSGEPLLVQLAALDSAGIVTTAQLACVADGWVELLEPMPLDRDALNRYASARGGGIFDAASQALGADAPDWLLASGEGWALADFGLHCSDPETARRALALADEKLTAIGNVRVPRQLRPLGMLAHLAARDVATRGPRRQGSPARMWRMLRHRLTGR